MRLVSTSARALALALSFGSLSMIFSADTSPRAVALAPIAGERVPAAASAPPSAAGAAVAPSGPANDSGDAMADRAKRRKARARQLAAVRRAQAIKAAKTRRIAAIRAERARLARLPWTKRVGFEWPAQGWITSGVGTRGKGYHHGTDIACRKGSLIRASKSGVVVFVKHMKIYGKTVVIQHAYGFSTLYAHMQKIHTRVGQRVRTQQIIGRCGSTGRSTGPHLHFELRRNGKFLKPGHYLP